MFSKTGTVQFGPANTDTLFSGFGGACQTTNDGNGIVRYDGLANRWVITQFANVQTSGPFFECVAVSQTGPNSSSSARPLTRSPTTINANFAGINQADGSGSGSSRVHWASLVEDGYTGHGRDTVADPPWVGHDKHKQVGDTDTRTPGDLWLRQPSIYQEFFTSTRRHRHPPRSQTLTQGAVQIKRDIELLASPLVLADPDMGAAKHWLCMKACRRASSSRLATAGATG